VTKKVLGRGLRALIPPPEMTRTPSATQLMDQPRREEQVDLAVGEPQHQSTGSESIPVNAISRNPEQPRRHFDDDALDSLAASIRLHGVLQPILVRRTTATEYELVAGERRWLASQRAGLTTIPAHVRDIPDDALLETALVENIQRRDLNPIEEAEAYRRLIEEWRLTQTDVSLRVGRDRSSIANCLRLLSLPESVKQLVSTGRISEGHGRAIVSLGSSEQMTRLATEVVESGINVRQTETRVRELLGVAGDDARKVSRRSRKTETTPTASDPHVRALVDELTGALSTKVDLRLKPDGRGEISIEFYSIEDLDRVSAIIAHR
jgi:ParB family chromosome partitioning protein